MPHKTLIYSEEGYSRLTLNDVGLNDTDLSATTRPYRVIALGDSYTAAVHVNRSANFTTLLEQHLPKVDILNAGRNGLNPLTFAPMLQEYLPTYPANLTLVIMNHSDLKDIEQFNTRVSYDSAGNIVAIERQDYAPNALRWQLAKILQHSALMTYIMKRSELMLRDPIKRLISQFQSIRNYLSVVSPSSTQHSISSTKHLELATYLLQELRAKTPLIVIYIPQFSYTNQGLQPLFDDLKTEHIYAQAAQRAAIPFYSLRDVFRADYTATGIIPIGFHNGIIGKGHLNSYGHQLVAKNIAPLINRHLPHQ